MWDEKDGFYYDLLRLPDGSATHLKVRSMVGLLPLCATTVIEPWQRERVPHARRQIGDREPKDARVVAAGFIATGPGHLGVGGTGNHGSRHSGAPPPASSASCSVKTSSWVPMGFVRFQSSMTGTPMCFHVNGQEYRVGYLPAESDTGMFGGNSNWRGTGLGSGQCAHHSSARSVLFVLWRYVQGGMSHRLRSSDESVRGGQRDF